MNTAGANGGPRASPSRFAATTSATRSWARSISVGIDADTAQFAVHAIAATTSTKGLKVYAQLDENEHQRGVKISDTELAAVNISRDDYHGTTSSTDSIQAG